MCGSKPKVPKIEPLKPTAIPPIPPPPPPPEPTPTAPVIQSDEQARKQKTESNLQAARRTGTRALRIDLLIPGPGSGLNVPS
jgi:hypothetical protein